MPWLAAIGPMIPGLIGAIGGLIGQQDAARGAKHNIQDIPLWSNLSNQVTPFNPSTYGAGSSSVSPQFTQIDPTITGLRRSILGNLSSLYPQAGSIYGGMLGEAGANEGGFVSSAVAPVEQQVANAWGDLMTNQARTGLRGTSFGNNDVQSFATNAGRALSDATASALERSFGVRSGLADRFFGSQQGILGQEEMVNQDQLQQVLAGLGLSQRSIALMLGRQEALNQATGGGAAGQGAGLMGLGGMLGNVLKALPIGGGGGGGGVPSGNFSMAG